VNYSLAVRKHHRITNLAEDREQRGPWVFLDGRSVTITDEVQYRLKGTALHQLHRIKWATLCIYSDIVNRNNIWMRELGQHFCFLRKSRIFTIFTNATDLYRHVALELWVVPKINLPHPATRNLTQ
jgi:hypothetical protein